VHEPVKPSQDHEEREPKVEELIGSYIVKPEGSPTLVPEWDKRPELKSTEAAQDAFKDVVE